MSAGLQLTEHRPWRLPNGPWVMAQSWHDLLFAHWPLNVTVLRHLIPDGLEIDTYQGQAWLGIVPFRMSGVRLRGTPAVPGLSSFPELNVRTYVTAEEKPGVWFFSLDAANRIAVAIARAWFHLPYFRARMSCKQSDGWIEYRSERKHRGARGAQLRARYRSAGNVFHAKPGSLEHFLTERYCLYTTDGEGRLLRGEIHHPAWNLQNAEADFAVDTMAQAAGIPLPQGSPVLHFSRRQDMVAWSPEPLRR
jgi:uncharacterized protein